MAQLSKCSNHVHKEISVKFNIAHRVNIYSKLYIFYFSWKEFLKFNLQYIFFLISKRLILYIILKYLLYRFSEEFK